MGACISGASLGQKRPPAPDDLGVNAVRVATGVRGGDGSQEREGESLKLLSGITIQPSSMGTVGDAEL